jgi:ribosomal protein S12 methylthiotransferase
LMLDEMIQDTATQELTVSFVSLGCAKNLVDSEKMLGQLAEAGCVLVSGDGDADVVVINTCGFLSASRDEAHDVIREAVAAKEEGRCRRVVVAGCLVQRDGGGMSDAVPGIDALVGVNNRDDVVRAVLGETGWHVSADAASRQINQETPTSAQGGDVSLAVIGGGVEDGRPGRRPLQEIGSTRNGRADGPELFLGDYHPFQQTDFGRLRITPRHYAYLRISEGCDQKCTFCTIPSIRGPMHCKPPQVVMAEARELVADGAVEISLIGQDTTSYGFDIGYDRGLAGMLRELNTVNGLRWLRLMYVYPSIFTDDMIDAIDSSDKVVNYIDIPLQHINDRMLKAMHRRVTRAETEALLAKLRQRIPAVHIRTTMIAGFPGETDAEFEELVDFVRDFGFDALGVFPYSLEPDTPAGRMKHQLPDEVKQQRVDHLMTVQQEVAFRRADDQVGRRVDVLLEEAVGEIELPAELTPHRHGTKKGRKGKAGRSRTVSVRQGRHYGQAPGVDSVTWVAKTDGQPGMFVESRIVGRSDYDLLAVPVGQSLPVIAGA